MAEEEDDIEPIKPEHLEIRLQSSSEWKSGEDIFQSQEFQTGGFYSDAFFESRHVNYEGTQTGSLPPPCVAHPTIGLDDDIDLDNLEELEPVDTADSFYAECLNPAEFHDAAETYDQGLEAVMSCQSIGELDVFGPDPLAPEFDACVPFDDMPSIDGWDWNELIDPPHYSGLGDAWCTTTQGQECGVGVDRIEWLSGWLSGTGLQEASRNIRDNGELLSPVTAGEPTAIFVAINGISAMIAHDFAHDFAPLGPGWKQLADATGDPRFHHASFQDSVAPLNYGIAGVLYAAAWAPQLADGDIEFDEYFDHVSSAAAAGAVLGAVNEVDNLDSSVAQ